MKRTVVILAALLLVTFCTKRESVSTSTVSTTSVEATTTTAVAAPATPPTQTVVTESTSAPAAAAPAGSSIASQDTNWPNITAEVIEFRRKGNTLTAKVRFTNKGSEEPQVEVLYGETYLIDTAGGKKYGTLKDEKGSYIAALHSGWQDRWYEHIKPGAPQTIWIKFPAPPPEVKAITLQIPKTPPFEDLPIQD
ncbi:MAG: hypothetical protein ACXW2F_00435 [Thermoanaerobaculia bacterium]